MGFLNNLGGVEWVIIIVIVLLVFGGGLVKTVAKRAGETTKEVKKAKDIFEKAAKDEPEDKTDN
jgi:TatA/E family protein of Tat protein translocase